MSLESIISKQTLIIFNRITSVGYVVTEMKQLIRSGKIAKKRIQDIVQLGRKVYPVGILYETEVHLTNKWNEDH